MKREDLKLYRHSQKWVKEQLEKYEGQRTMAMNISQNLDGMPKAKGYVESNIEKQIVEREEKIEEKERYIRELKSKLKVVEDLVKILKKYNQDIIEMRYYSMMSIEEIATRKDKTYGAIKKALDRSIGKMQREYNRNKRVS